MGINRVYNTIRAAYGLGGWVESCTAITKTHDGKMQVVYWLKEFRKRNRLSCPTKL